MFKVLFVCMGNICRSPTAEGVFRHMLREMNLEDKVDVDSAGTHGYHVGEAPDQRTQRAAARRGYDLSGIRARKIAPQDLDYFDLILAMDRNSLEALHLVCPPERTDRLGLFMDYSKNFDDDEVPDPYYGLGQGFDLVLDMVEDATRGLVDIVKERAVLAAEVEKKKHNQSS
ncbi:low molecular weight protein-tyrosine-phosphatase [Propionivibrio sp.]|uniref:low molecular weight protein-tyrosine-phosphatase n=1 Tax=Propionivibrio sp. TaxID=2212460 RepID=UPI003BF155F0